MDRAKTDAVYNRISRVRNSHNPFELLAQQMEGALRAYQSERESREWMDAKLAEHEAEAARLRTLIG